MNSDANDGWPPLQCSLPDLSDLDCSQVLSFVLKRQFRYPGVDSAANQLHRVADGFACTVVRYADLSVGERHKSRRHCQGQRYD